MGARSPLLLNGKEVKNVYGTRCVRPWDFNRGSMSKPPLIVERMFANVQFCERVIVGGGKAPMASTAGFEPTVAESKSAVLTT